MRKALLLGVVVTCTSILSGAFAVSAASVITPYTSTAIDYVDSTTDSFTSSSNLGFNSLSNSDISFRYVPGSSHNICSATFGLKAIGSPDDAIFLNVTYWGLQSGGFGPDFSSQLSTQGTFVANANAGIQVRNTSGAAYTYEFSPCLVVVGDNVYQFNLFRSGAVSGSNYYQYSSTPSSGYSEGGSWDITEQRTYRRFSNNTGVVNTYPATGVFALIAFNGTENFGVTEVPKPTLDIGDILSGLNEANSTSSLQTSLGGFATIPSLLAQKYPFNYLAEFVSVFDLFYQSTTTTFYAYTLDLHSLGIGSTTPMGNFLPRWTFLSTTTISTYYPDDVRIRFYTLQAFAMIVGWVFLMYRRITRLFNTT